jgi:3-phosphoshikimate 1-carboxyvinyltransferase
MYHSWKIPSSKSYMARLLILGAQNDTETQITFCELAQDSLDLIIALSELGAEIKKGHNFLTIKKHKLYQQSRFINAGEGATSLRFLLALLALDHNQYQVEMKGSLATRPHKELLELLQIDYQIKGNVLTLQGPSRLKESVHTKDLVVEAYESSQYYSALKLIEHQLPCSVHHHLQGSKSYAALTDYLKREFIEKKTRKFACPIDLSSLAFVVAYGLHIHSIKAPYINDKFQADGAIVEILDLIQASYTIDDAMIRVEMSDQLCGFHFDFNPCPDLFPAACFIAAYAKGKSEFILPHSLALKESNRIEQMIELLNWAQIKCELVDNVLTIEGESNNIKKLSSQVFANDHRIVMTQALFLMKNKCPINIKNKTCSFKSFPSFFSQLEIFDS